MFSSLSQPLPSLAIINNSERGARGGFLSTMVPSQDSEIGPYHTHTDDALPASRAAVFIFSIPIYILLIFQSIIQIPFQIRNNF